MITLREDADQWFATGMINQTLESLDRLINWEPIRNVHMATDAETNVITDVEVTPASHHDATVFEQFLTGEEPSVYADKAYDGDKRRQRLKEDGTEDCIMKRASRGHPLSDEAKAVNRIIGKIRSRIERKIGELKLWHGFSRMRYIGLARSKIQTFLVVIVVNLKFLVSRFA
jgi:IS5 family transposase